MVTSGNGNELYINTTLDVDYADAQKQLDQLKKMIDEVTEEREVKIKILADLESGDFKLSDLTKDIEDLTKSIQELTDQAREIAKKISTAGANAPNGGYRNSITKKAFGIQKMQNPEGAGPSRALGAVGGGANNEKGIWNSIKGGATKMSNIGKGIVGRLTGTFRSGMAKMSNGVKQFQQPVKSFEASVMSLVKRAAALAGLTTIVGKFVGYLKQVLNKNAEFRKAMADLKGALYTLAQPLIEWIIPIVIKMVQVLTLLVRNLANLVSKAFGKSLGDMAANAEATNNSLKEIQKTVAGYDELNVIDKNEDTEIKPDFGDVTEGVLDITDPLVLGKLLAERINEALASVDWEEVGRTIGKGLDFAIKFAYSFLKTLDFTAIGTYLAQMINGCLDEVDTEYLGRLIVRWFTIIPDMILGFLMELDFGLVGEKLAGLLIGIFDEFNEWYESKDWDEIKEQLIQKIRDFFDGFNSKEIKDKAKEAAENFGALIGDFFDLGIKSLNEIVTSIDFAGIGSILASGFNSIIDQIDFKGLGALLANGLTTISDLIIGFVRDTDWGDLMASVSDTIIGFFDTLSAWFDKYDWEEIGGETWDDIKDIFEGSNLGGIFTSLFTFLGKAVGALSRYLIGLIGGIWTDVKNWWDENIQGNSWDETAANLLAAILEGIGDIGAWVQENIIDPFMGALLGDEEWGNLKAKIAENADMIIKIGAPIALVLGITLLFFGHWLIGLGLVLTGITALAYQSVGGDWSQLRKTIQDNIGSIIMVGEALLLVIGLVLTFMGHFIIGIGLIIAGIAALAYTSANVNWDGLKTQLQGTAGAIVAGVSGLALVIGLVLLFTGVSFPLGIGLVLVGAAGLAAEVAVNWNWLVKQLQDKADIIAGISGLLLVIGVVLLFTGVGIPLGIGLVAAGAAGLAATAAANWESLKKTITDNLDKILAIGGSLMLVIGLILVFTGVGLPVGLALIAAGAAALWKPASQSAQSFAEKVGGWVEEAKKSIQEKWAGVKESLAGAFESAKETAQEIMAEGEGKEGLAKAVAIGAGAIKKIWTGSADGTGEGGVKGALIKAWTGLSGLAESAIGKDDSSGLRGVYNNAKKGIAKLWTGKEDGTGTEGVRGAIKKAWDGISGVAEKAIGKDGTTGVGKVFQTCKEGIAQLWTGKKDGTGTEGVRGALKSAWNNITTVAQNVVGKDGNTGLGKVFNTAKGAISTIWKGSDGNGGLKGVLNGIFGGMKGNAESNLGADDQHGLRYKFNVAKQGITKLWKGSDGKGGLKGVIDGIFGGMKGNAEANLGADDQHGLRYKFNLAKQGITKLWKGSDGKGGLKGVIDGIFGGMKGNAEANLGADDQHGLRYKFNLAKQGITKLWKGSDGKGGLKGVIDGIFGGMKGNAENNLGADDQHGLRYKFNLAKQGITKLWKGSDGNGGLKGIINGIFGGMKGSAESGLGANDQGGLRSRFAIAKSAISNMWRGSDGNGGLKGIINGIFGGMANSAASGLGTSDANGLKGKFLAAKNTLANWWQGANGNGGLKGVLNGIWGSMTGSAGDALGANYKPNSLLGKLWAFKDSVVSWFTGSGGLAEKINGVWTSIKTGLIIALRGIVNAINFAIDGLNAILIPLRAVIYGIGKAMGSNWTFQDVSIPHIPLPGFAMGTVVPPNRKFLAVLGDNKKEPEVVSPISTMREAVRAEIESLGLLNQNQAPIILQVDGKILAQVVWDEDTKRYKQYGAYVPTRA